MGEAKMLTTSSETKSGKRRLLFEPLPSRDLNLERHSTLSEGSISLLQVWWVVERPRSYFSPAGRLFEPKKFTERVLRTTWGGRWSAIDVLCEALFVNFFGHSEVDSFKRQKFVRIRAECSRGFWGPPKVFLRLFRENWKFPKLSHFSSKIAFVACASRDWVESNINVRREWVRQHPLDALWPVVHFSCDRTLN